MDRKYYAFARKYEDGTYGIFFECVNNKILVASKAEKIDRMMRQLVMSSVLLTNDSSPTTLEGIVIDLLPLVKAGIVSENKLFELV